MADIIIKNIRVSDTQFKIKTRKPNGTTEVVLYDFSNHKGITYINADPEANVQRIEDVYGIDIRLFLKSGDAYWSGFSIKTETYPLIGDLKEGETATDEPADRTVYFPDPEFPHEFEARMEPRIHAIADLISDGFGRVHSDAHLTGSARDQCNDLGSGHANARAVSRTAIAHNAPVGHLWQQFKACVQKTAGSMSESEIETLTEKVEGFINDPQKIREFYRKHNLTEWDESNEAKKVQAINADFSPGETLIDFMVENASSSTPNAAAEKAFDHVVESCFHDALHSLNTELVTEVTQDLPHRAKIRELQTAYNTKPHLTELRGDFSFMEKSASVALSRVAGVQINIFRTLAVTVNDVETDFNDDDSSINLWCPLDVTTESFEEPAERHRSVKMITVKTNDHAVKAVYGDTTVTLAKNTTTEFTAGQIYSGLTLTEPTTTETSDEQSDST